jgi:hypothetical protein
MFTQGFRQGMRAVLAACADGCQDKTAAARRHRVALVAAYREAFFFDEKPLDLGSATVSLFHGKSQVAKLDGRVNALRAFIDWREDAWLKGPTRRILTPLQREQGATVASYCREQIVNLNKLRGGGGGAVGGAVGAGVAMMRKRLDEFIANKYAK